MRSSTQEAPDLRTSPRDGPPSESSCAGCRRAVTGCAGDIKVYVGHENLVLCLACFQQHPRRSEWLGSDLAGSRTRPMLRDRAVAEPSGAPAGARSWPARRPPSSWRRRPR